uniref:NADH dehydrogenase [ubiquinone] 1 subunit C2 n=1 Tax=Geotrypetes seraphini TaxID=260995 RepID=A0A6P8SI56_GEOSA|nr:NADH dehydrogenase [ubiquinone] 1 subunit C2-like [Geotrypetes seraphini]
MLWSGSWPPRSSWIPDEARYLPPLNIVNQNSVWVTSMLDNLVNHQPPLRTGVHHQILFVTVGIFLGYYMTKHENYHNAKLDRDLTEYMQLHPDDFKKKEKKTFAEYLKKFYPIR